MLDLVDRRFGRRSFLRVGGLSLGGLTLPGLLSARAAAAELGPVARDKSVVFLFLHGGPSQFETFDPKPSAPSSIRCANGIIPTKLPGVSFGSALPRLAQLADRFSIVRSFTTGSGAHDIKPIVGKETDGANIGSLYSRVVGTNRPADGMPTNIALFPRSVRPESGPRQQQFGKFDSSGQLGSAYSPFIPGGEGDVQKNMTLNVPMQRLDDRRLLLSGLDRIKADVDATGVLDGVDRIRQQAFDTILGGVAEAFDLSKEDPRTVARYDTAPLMHPDTISDRWNNRKHYIDNSQTLGKLLLLARRLCERGAGFVTVTTNFVWDMHADANNATVEEGFRYMGPPLDHALSAFLEDLEARGLSEKVLLVTCGEMGRTPKINKKGGRDHWGGLAPLLLAGGGLPMGQVVGQSDSDGGRPRTTPVTNAHLVSTILHTLLDTGELRLQPSVPQEIIRMAGHATIPGLA